MFCEEAEGGAGAEFLSWHIVLRGSSLISGYLAYCDVTCPPQVKPDSEMFVLLVGFFRFDLFISASRAHRTQQT